MLHSRATRAVLAILLTLPSLAGVLFTASAVSAAPALDVAVSAPDAVLIGVPATVSVTATNNTATPGYNTGVAVVLPAGVSFTSSPQGGVVLANTPAAGQTTVWFENVNDSQPAASVDVTLDVTASTGAFPVGSSFTVDATAYTSDDPRTVPAADGTGATGTGTAAATVDVTAITITKTEPSPEAELLRGVHDHSTVYTLEIENNPTNATDAVVVDDYLPAGLEFLGCGTVDNTTDAPTFSGNNVEYSGAPRLDVSTPDLTVDCPAPTLVETVDVDPDGAGPLPQGIYTHVRWSIGNHAASQITTITYAAAIPIRENTLTWSGATPDTLGGQAANLDNNSGAETVDEQLLVNHSMVAGTYTSTLAAGASNPVGDTDDYEVTAEDIRLLKSVDVTNVTQNTDSVWTLTINTSEYRTVDNLDITDTLPDGHCPLGPVNYDASDSAGECDPSGTNPSTAYTSVVENADGSWTLFWDDAATMTASDTFVLTFPSRVRTYYQESGADDTPVVTNDGFTNTVTLTADDHLIAGIPADEADGTTDVDASSASQTASNPLIEKTVSVPTAPGVTLDCATASYIPAETLGSAPFAYRPGDVVCYTLRVEIPANLTFKNSLITDFLPAGVTFLADLGPTGANTIAGVDFDGPLDWTDGTPAATGDATLAWELGTTDIGGDRYLPISSVARVFEVRFSAEFTGAPTGDGSSLQKANLMKLTTQNSAGAAISLRDQSLFIAVEPELTIDKSTTATVVAGTDTADFTVTIANVADVGSDAGYAAAENVSVSDILPAPFTCTDVTTIDVVAGASDDGCIGDTITWTITSLDAGASIDLTYTLTVPDTVPPGRSFVNTATIDSFEQSTNDGGTAGYTPGTSDTASISSPAAPVTKRQVSAIDEAGNGSNGSLSDAADQATIGETITYQVTATVPEGTSVYNAFLQDLLPPEITETAGSYTYTLDSDGAGGAAPVALPTGGLTVNGTHDWQIDFGATYTNAAGTGDDIVTMTFQVTVDDDTNAAGDLVRNRGRFFYETAVAGGENDNNLTGYRDTTIVEPNPQIAKTDNTGGTPVGAGQTVGYTLTLTNPTAANVSVAHDLVIVDTVPPRIEPQTGTISGGGTWNSGPRTITWNIASLDPGASVALTYDAVTVDPLPAGGSIDNTATVTATSMAGVVAGERTTYSDTDTDSLATVSASLTKALTPDTGPYTIGETVTYQLVSTVPQNTVAYDHSVTDLVPDGVVFDSATFSLGAGCSITGDTVTSNPALTLTEAQADGSTLVAFFLGDTAAPTTDCVITIDTVAHVDSTYDGTGSPAAGAAVVASDVMTNSAESNWMYADTVTTTPSAVGDLPGSWDSQSNTATASFDVSEPLLVIDKDVTTVTGCDAVHDDDPTDDDACVIEPGHGTLTYTLTITNDGDEPAHDVVVTDQPDAELTNVVLGTGSADNTDGWTVGDPAMSWTHVGPLAAGSSVTYTYTADLVASSSLTSTSVVTNTADVPTYFGLDATARGTSPNERTYGTTFGPVTADTVDLTLDFPALTVAKTVADGSEFAEAVTGQAFLWRVAVTNAAGTATAADVDVADVLPNNWTYDAGSSELCSPGCVAIADPTVGGAAATGHTLDWTDLGSLAAGETFEVRFTATPQTGALTDAGTTPANPHVNTASATADDASGASSNGSGPYASATDTASGVIYEADVSLVKSILTAGPYLVGQTVTYQVVVTNDGPDAATGVVVDEILDGGELIYNGTVAVDGSYDSGTGEWTLPATLANGATATLQLSVILDHDGTITNTAQVVAADRFDTDSTPNNGIGTEDDQDSVTILTDTASLGSTVWFDVDNSGGDETTKGVEPGFAGVTVTLESQGNDNTYGTADDFFGPDGVVGGGDDITVTSAVTDANGNYAFLDLHDGTYRVVVDTSTLPGGTAGWTQTYDDNATMDATSGDIVLTTGATSYVDADFSFTGAGSLGDQVWWDVDNSADGVFDNSAFPGGQDQPIAGVDAELTWAGFDGTFGTADDIVYPTDTTDAAGFYGFTQLAPGEYRVTFDTTDLPSGLTNQTWDVVHTGPGGGDGDPAATVDVTLTAGENRTDVDASFVGTASLGDQLWLDVDGDGIMDAGEPGLGAVTVTAVWFGSDGVAGGGDDITLVTETAGDGTYTFANLPPGEFSVTVDTGDPDFPAGLTQTFDLDGIVSPDTTVVSLADGQDRTDADFGYTGVGSVGDLVWFDFDADGSLNGPDLGIAGADLVVTWAGPDGLFDTADDVDVPATTNASGIYGVGNLPYGDVRVRVVPAELPAGVTQTYDLDATLDNVTIVTLTAGIPDRLDLDFGYRGTASIGDTVWVDDDADFVLDGTETGIAGVTVQLTLAGADNTLETADDLVLTTTTDTSGVYGFAGLPVGDVQITLVGGTPADMAIVTELDTVLDSTWSGTLGAGENRTDVDFGLRVDADLAITKSHTGDFAVNDSATYVISVTNAGPAVSVATVVTDALPIGLTYVNATGATCAVDTTGIVTCDLGDLAVDATATVTLTVAVAEAAAPRVDNTATVAGDTADRDLSDNSDTDPTEVPLAQIVLTKSLLDVLTQGEQATYRLSVVNQGPSPATEVVLVDALPAGLRYVSATGTGWTCSEVSDVVSCSLSGDLAVGAASVLDIEVDVELTAAGTITNLATAATSTDQLILSDDRSSVAGSIVVRSAALPQTGSNTGSLLPFGLGLVLVGALLLFTSRRRDAATPLES